MRAQYYLTAILAVLSEITVINASSRRDLLQGSNNGPSQALVVAVTDSKLSTVEKLLDPKKTKPVADVDSKNAVGSTPLMIAAASGDIDILKVLLSSGAQVNLRNDDGFAALHFAASEKAAAELLKAKANIEIKTNRGATPLYIATQNSRIGVMKFLIKKGADVDAEFSNGAPPLLVAAETGNVKSLTVLLEGGATVSKGNGNEVTAMHLAASIKDGTEAVELLLYYGVDVDVKDMWGDTPLDYAAYFGNEAVVDLLLARGADMALPDVRENLPLRSLCRCQDAEGSPGQLQCPEGNCSREQKEILRAKLDPEQVVEVAEPVLEPEEDLPVVGANKKANSKKLKRKKDAVSEGGKSLTESRKPRKSKKQKNKPKLIKVPLKTQEQTFLPQPPVPVRGCSNSCRSFLEDPEIWGCFWEPNPRQRRHCLAEAFPECVEPHVVCDALVADMRIVLIAIYTDCSPAIDVFKTQCLMDKLYTGDGCPFEEDRVCQAAIIEELGSKLTFPYI